MKTTNCKEFFVAIEYLMKGKNTDKTLLNRGFNHIYREISNKGQGSVPTTKPVQIFNPLPNEVYLEQFTFTLHLMAAVQLTQDSTCSNLYPRATEYLESIVIGQS